MFRQSGRKEGEGRGREESREGEGESTTLVEAREAGWLAIHARVNLLLPIFSELLNLTSSWQLVANVSSEYLSDLPSGLNSLTHTCICTPLGNSRNNPPAKENKCLSILFMLNRAEVSQAAPEVWQESPSGLLHLLFLDGLSKRGHHHLRHLKTLSAANKSVCWEPADS